MPVFLPFARHRSLLAALGFVLLGLLLRSLMPKPYAWVLTWLCWGAAFAVLAAGVRPVAAKYACITAFSLFFALFAAEAWLSLDAPKSLAPFEAGDINALRAERDDPGLMPYQSNIDKADPVLGAGPRAEASRTGSRFYRDGKLLYDVVYTTLESGWRVTPQHPEARRAVIFFGCSFTFGQGLDDAQSIPYRVGELLGSDYQVYNFALYGYGAHQMLAQIEHGFLEGVAGKYEEATAFFITIDGHELRCSGAEDWVKSGPLYAIDGDGVTRVGDIRNMKRRSLPPLRKFLRNSLVFRRLFGRADPRLGEYRELHAAIIAQAAKTLRERYAIPLTVLQWPGAPFAEPLRRRGLEPLELGPALPGWEDDVGRYLIPLDGHPNALGAECVARHVADLVRRHGRAAERNGAAQPE